MFTKIVQHYRNTLYVFTFMLFDLSQAHRETRRLISSRRQSILITEGTTRSSVSHEEETEFESLERYVSQIGMDIRRKARISKTNLDGLGTLLGKGMNLGDHGTFLLKCCSKNYLPDKTHLEIVQLSQKMWSAIEGEGRRTLEHFEILLQCYTDNEFMAFDPWMLLEDYRASIKSNSGTAAIQSFPKKLHYLALLAYCQRGDLINAVKVLQLVKKEGCLVDETYFNALILGNSRAGDLSSAKEILSIMKSSHVTPSIKTFTILMKSCLEHNKLDSLSFVYNLSRREVDLTELDVIELASMATLKGNSKAFDEILTWLPTARKSEDSLRTLNVIVSTIHSGYPREAFRILTNWANGLHLTRAGYGISFIKELVYSNLDSTTLISICEELNTKGYDQFALNSATEYSLRKKRFELALTLFKFLRTKGYSLRPHYFWPLITHNFGQDGLAGLITALQTMTSFEVKPDFDTYIEYIVPRLFSLESDPVQVAKITKDSVGLSYSSGSFKAILTYLLKQRRLSDASSFARKLRGELSQPNTIIELLFRCLQLEPLENIRLVVPILKAVYQGKPSDDKADYVGKFLLRFVGSIGLGMPDLTSILIQSIEDEDIAISKTTAELIEAKLQRRCNIKIQNELTYIENTNFNTMFTHPKDMDTLSLECHAQELKTKQMNTRGVLRRLFLKYCQETELSKALEVKTEFEKTHGLLSLGMKAALLALYTRKGNVEASRQLYDDLKSNLLENSEEEAWRLDLHKLFDLVTLMARNGDIEGAYSLLVTDGLIFPKPEDKTLLTRNVVRVLEAFCSHSGNSNTDFALDVADFLFHNKLVIPSSPVLNVVIKNLVETKQLEKAVELFEEYTRKYKITPGSQFLAYAVLNNKILLEKYTKACVSVHGEINVKHQLAYSASDMGNTHEAAKMFSNLGDKLDLVRILKYCDYLGERNEIRKLLNLVKSLVDTRRNIDTSKIYMVALKSCQRHHDRQNLLLIMECLEQEQDIKSPNLFSSVFRYAHKLKIQLA